MPPRSPDVSVDKTKYMVMYQDQNAGRIHKIKTNIVTVTVRNSSNIWKNHKNSIFYSGKDKEQTKVTECLVLLGAEFLSSSLLSKNIQTKIDRTTILPVVLYGCGTWSLKLSEERRLKVFENRVLREIFGAKTE